MSVSVICDLCGQPIKTGKLKQVIVISEEHLIKQASGEYGFDQEEPTQMYEICEECEKIIKQIFKLRKANINKLTDMLETTYKLPTKERKKIIK
jgi:hypothetical protein